MKIKNILILLISLCFSVASVFSQTKKDQEKITVSGVVLDASTGKPLNGMNISLTGISAAMTNEKGEFTIKVPSYEVELIFSGPAYQQKKVALKGRSSLVVRLNESEFKTVYSDVLMPLGNVSNTNISHAVSIYAEDPALNTVTSPEMLLQGKISGLNTISRSGMEGAGGNMFLRGFNSIYANSQPLLVIDGMVVENVSAGTSLLDGFLSTPIGDLDVKDISRISVLKDGTTLYGTKGANGVLLIETMRGKSPDTKIDINVRSGMNMKPTFIPVLKSSDQKRYLMDLYQSAGYSSTQIQNLPFINSEIPILQNWGYEGNADYYRYNKETNWQDLLFNNGFKNDYSLNVTGGDDVALYAISLGYLLNEGLIKGTDYSQFHARVNSDINFSKTVKIQTYMNFTNGKRDLVEQGDTKSTNPLYSSLTKASFMAPNVYDQDNLMSPNLEDVDMFGNSNPLAILNNAEEISSNYGFLGNVNISWNLWKDLTLSSVFGIRYNKEREKVFFPSVGVSYEELPAAQVENEQQHRVERYFSIFSDTRANYLFKFSHDHLLNTTVGMRYQKNNVEDDWGKGYNSPSDKFRSIQYGLSELRQAGGALGEWRWFSIYGNADYSLKSKYFINATASFDNSTRFGSAISALQPYGSLSAAWLISSENFMANVDYIDMLKLRVGYSTSGNDDIGNYAALRYYQPQNLMGNYGLVRGNIVNPNLRPETNATLNAGLDIALLNERLSISADVYRSEIRNMIIYPTAKDISGFSSYISNGGAMRNIGLDLTLNARLVNTSVKWDLGATASFYKNKITKLEEGNFITQISDANILTSVGNPLGLFYGYKTNGVYTTDAEAQKDGLKVKRGLNDYAFSGGDVRFVNQNADKYIDEKDMKVIGNPNPDVFGGFNTSVKWKRIKATANFLYSIGNDIYNQTRRTLESMSTFANQTEVVLNRWKVDGQVTSVPKAVYGDPMGNSRFSDRWIEDGSYLKFKNLTLSYDLPIKQGVFTGIQLYGVVDNIYTFTSYKGYDPEFSMTTSPLGYGIDSFIVPQSRTFYVGLKIGL